MTDGKDKKNRISWNYAGNRHRIDGGGVYVAAAAIASATCPNRTFKHRYDVLCVLCELSVGNHAERVKVRVRAIDTRPHRGTVELVRRDAVHLRDHIACRPVSG